MGYQSKANGHYSMALGQSCIAQGDQSYAIGHLAKANVGQSYAIGRFVETSTSGAFIIGSGLGPISGQQMVNSIANSLMIGFQSTVPTFFVGTTPPGSQTGNVGIATTDPKQKLHVIGNILLSGTNNNGILFDDETLNGSSGEWGIQYKNGGLNFWKPTGSNTPGDNFVFIKDDGKVGIGTGKPETKLDVNGIAKVNSLFSVGNVQIGSSESDGNMDIFGMLNVSKNAAIGNKTVPANIDIWGITNCYNNINIGTEEKNSILNLYGTQNIHGVTNCFSVLNVGTTEINSTLNLYGPQNTYGQTTCFGDVQMGTSQANSTLTLYGSQIVNGSLLVSSLASSEGNKMIISDSQGLLSLQDIPVGADDLGSHIATRNIRMNGFYLSGDGDNEGIFVNAQGKVGIGTSNPAARLEIRTSGQENKVLMYASSNNQARLWVANDISAYSIGIGSDGKGHIFTNLNSPSAIMTFSDGNVGIGITPLAGTHKLYVAGGITTEEVKVKLSSDWGDFVFEDSYKLASLKEVEIFIKKNKHLPDIPSAKEVSDNGIELAQMNNLLLQKVEELTLYIIEQDKRIKQLEGKISEGN
ncbi:MAG: hypothetical protein M0R21_01450 [Lentimicrobiaceae bacterium]|nr:hypothetical protein [Lentimicrobiaceae bacterium]